MILMSRNVAPFEQSLYRFLDTSHPALLKKIRERKAIDDEIKGRPGEGHQGSQRKIQS